mgnify:FL=1
MPARPQSWPPGVQALARPLGPPAPARLAELTTLRVGGPVGSYLEAGDEEEIIGAVREADDSGTSLLVLGGGSNVLAHDDGFAGLVLRDARQRVVLAADTDCGGVEFTATAGTTWDDLVREAIASHWGGFEIGRAHV